VNAEGRGPGRNQTKIFGFFYKFKTRFLWKFSSKLCPYILYLVWENFFGLNRFLRLDMWIAQSRSMAMVIPNLDKIHPFPIYSSNYFPSNFQNNSPQILIPPLNFSMGHCSVEDDQKDEFVFKMFIFCLLVTAMQFFENTGGIEENKMEKGNLDDWRQNIPSRGTSMGIQFLEKSKTFGKLNLEKSVQGKRRKSKWKKYGNWQNGRSGPKLSKEMSNF
jgi:hypothetical protein